MKIHAFWQHWHFVYTSLGAIVLVFFACRIVADKTKKHTEETDKSGVVKHETLRGPSSAMMLQNLQIQPSKLHFSGCVDGNGPY